MLTAKTDPVDPSSLDTAANPIAIPMTTSSPLRELIGDLASQPITSEGVKLLLSKIIENRETGKILITDDQNIHHSWMEYLYTAKTAFAEESRVADDDTLVISQRFRELIAATLPTVQEVFTNELPYLYFNDSLGMVCFAAKEGRVHFSAKIGEAGNSQELTHILISGSHNGIIAKSRAQNYQQQLLQREPNGRYLAANFEGKDIFSYITPTSNGRFLISFDINSQEHIVLDSRGSPIPPPFRASDKARFEQEQRSVDIIPIYLEQEDEAPSGALIGAVHGRRFVYWDLERDNLVPLPKDCLQNNLLCYVSDQHIVIQKQPIVDDESSSKEVYIFDKRSHNYISIDGKERFADYKHSISKGEISLLRIRQEGSSVFTPLDVTDPNEPRQMPFDGIEVFDCHNSVIALRDATSKKWILTNDLSDPRPIVIGELSGAPLVEFDEIISAALPCDSNNPARVLAAFKVGDEIAVYHNFDYSGARRLFAPAVSFGLDINISGGDGLVRIGEDALFKSIELNQRSFVLTNKNDQRFEVIVSSYGVDIKEATL